MDKTLAIPLTVVAGGFIALQAPINGVLGRTVGYLPAGAVSFAIGTLALVGITLLFGGGFGNVGEARGLPLVYFTGGVLGALYVTTALTTVRVLGAGGVTAATIAGQLLASIAADRLALFGLEQRPLSLGRLAGVALLAVGTYLIVRES
jgi:transporter family-2 protein